MSMLQWNRILNFQACVVHAVYFKDREQKLQQQQQATISLSGSCINIPASNQLQFSFVWIPFLVCWNKMKRKNSIRSVLLRMCVCIIWSWVFVFRVFLTFFCFLHLCAWHSRLLRLLEFCTAPLNLLLYARGMCVSFINLLIFFILSKVIQHICWNSLVTQQTRFGSNIAWESSFTSVQLFSVHSTSLLTQCRLNWQWKSDREWMAFVVYCSMSSFW